MNLLEKRATTTSLRRIRMTHTLIPNRLFTRQTFAISYNSLQGKTRPDAATILDDDCNERLPESHIHASRLIANRETRTTTCARLHLIRRSVSFFPRLLASSTRVHHWLAQRLVRYLCHRFIAHETTHPRHTHTPLDA